MKQHVANDKKYSNAQVQMPRLNSNPSTHRFPGQRHMLGICLAYAAFIKNTVLLLTTLHRTVGISHITGTNRNINVIPKKKLHEVV